MLLEYINTKVLQIIGYMVLECRKEKRFRFGVIDILLIFDFDDV